MPETIRAYALEKLVESGEAEATARRHAMFYGGLLELAGDLRSRPLIADIVGEAQEFDNVRAALTWALSPHGDKAIGMQPGRCYAPRGCTCHSNAMSGPPVCLHILGLF